MSSSAAPLRSLPPTSCSRSPAPAFRSSLIGFVLAGIGIGIVETAEHAAVAHLAPEGQRGSAFGLLATVQSLGNFAASAIAGLLWTLASPTAAFIYAAAWMLIALIAFTANAPPTPDQGRRRATRITTSVTAVTHATPSVQAADRPTEPENDRFHDHFGLLS